MGSSPISSFHPAEGRETGIAIEHCMFIDFAYAFG